ncbi:MAG: hypothetical protein GX310_07525, partial [Synergistaceae bacterium]|nr:hypothetical protein [Synergistaceae bacterium]
MSNAVFCINEGTFAQVNEFLADPKNEAIAGLKRVVGKFGSVSEINERAREAGRVKSLVRRLERINSPFVKDIEWLASARDGGKFISLSDYRAGVNPERPARDYDHSNAPTLEISALQYFPWLIAQARQCI